jgi:hypothetical protein
MIPSGILSSIISSVFSDTYYNFIEELEKTKIQIQIDKDAQKLKEQ